MLNILNIVCALILLATAVPRINDIRMDQWSLGWCARRVGLLLVSIWTVMFLLRLIGPLPPTASVLIVGVTLCWLTTPGMVPWWRYVSGMFSHHEMHGRREGDAQNH